MCNNIKNSTNQPNLNFYLEIYKKSLTTAYKLILTQNETQNILFGNILKTL